MTSKFIPAFRETRLPDIDVKRYASKLSGFSKEYPEDNDPSPALFWNDQGGLWSGVLAKMEAFKYIIPSWVSRMIFPLNDRERFNNALDAIILRSDARVKASIEQAFTELKQIKDLKCGPSTIAPTDAYPEVAPSIIVRSTSRDTEISEELQRDPGAPSSPAVPGWLGAITWFRVSEMVVVWGVLWVLKRLYS